MNALHSSIIWREIPMMATLSRELAVFESFVGGWKVGANAVVRG